MTKTNTWLIFTVSSLHPNTVGAMSDSCRAPQAHGSFGSEEAQEDEEEEEEDELPVPMTTRLRKQAERQRKKEREQEQRMTETISVSDGGEDVGCPSQWNVEQVFSYINSLPGTAVILTHLLSLNLTLLIFFKRERCKKVLFRL